MHLAAEIIVVTPHGAPSIQPSWSARRPSPKTERGCHQAGATAVPGIDRQSAARHRRPSPCRSLDAAGDAHQRIASRRAGRDHRQHQPILRMTTLPLASRVRIGHRSSSF